MILDLINFSFEIKQKDNENTECLFTNYWRKCKGGGEIKEKWIKKKNQEKKVNKSYENKITMIKGKKWKRKKKKGQRLSSLSKE